jgi:acyl-CoA thioesterase FadM
MVVMHLLRCGRLALRGRASAPKEVFDETTVNIYAGWRMVDAFGHINNSRYLELFELARWHEGGQKRYFSKFRKAEMYPTVAAAHIQFLKEIPPAQVVRIHTRTVCCNGRWFLVRQHMFDRTGTKLHATALFRIAMIDSSSAVKKSSKDPSHVAAQTPASVAVRRGPSSLTADEAIIRLGYIPDTIHAQLKESWLKELTVGHPETAEAVSTIAQTILKDVDELDESWRGLMRTVQEGLRRNKSPATTATPTVK